MPTLRLAISKNEKNELWFHEMKYEKIDFQVIIVLQFIFFIKTFQLRILILKPKFIEE